MSDLQFVKDILLQMQEEQHAQGKLLAGMEKGYEVRIKSLENSRNLNWWMTYVVTPLLMLAHGVARHFGVKV